MSDYIALITLVIAAAGLYLQHRSLKLQQHDK